MTGALDFTRSAIRERVTLWLGITFGFAAFYYLLLMASLIVRFGNFPNYVVPYDWFGNVARIIRSTPAVSDMVPIILDEWLLEIGYMNHSFGNGISEWALYFVPHKVAIILALGALIATNAVLLLRRRACSAATTVHAGAATGLGTVLVGLSSATMSWVVCCSTPSWVVGLSMLGLGVSTSLWLEPLGGWVMGLGFVTLALTATGLARRLSLSQELTSAVEPVAKPA